MAGRTLEFIGTNYVSVPDTTADITVQKGIDHYDALLFLSKYGDVYYNSFLAPVELFLNLINTTSCLNFTANDPTGAAFAMWSLGNTAIRVLFNTQYVPIDVYGIRYR